MSTYLEGLRGHVAQLRQRAEKLEDEARRLRRVADLMQDDADALAEEESTSWADRR